MSRFISFVILLILIPGPASLRADAQDRLEYLRNNVLNGTTEEKRDALHDLRIDGSAEAARAALPALNDPAPIVRATALGSLKALAQEEAASAILPLLMDKDEFVRLEASKALASTGSASTAQALANSLLRDRKLSVRSGAAEALGSVGTVASVAVLTQVLTKKVKDDDQLLRRSAARSIGRIASRMQQVPEWKATPESFLPPKFKPSLSERRSDLTAGSSEFASAYRVLLGVLANEKEASDTKREAAYAIGEIGSPAALTVLTNCLESRDPYLSEVCSDAAEKLR